MAETVEEIVARKRSQPATGLTAEQIVERQAAQAATAGPRPGTGAPQRLGNITPQPAAFVVRNGQPVSVEEQAALDPRVRGFIQNFTSGNSEEIANWLRKQGKTVERDNLDRLVISGPGDATPKVIDPARFELQDITDLLADVGVGYLTGAGSALARRAGMIAARSARPMVRAGMSALRGTLGLAGGGAGGAAVGETARQAVGTLAGEPIDPESIATTAALTGAAPIVTGGIARIAGRAGTVPQQTVRETMTAPMVGRGAAIGMVTPPVEEAEHLLGRELSASIKASRAMSKARPEFAPMLQQARDAGVKIDGIKIVDRVLANVDDAAVEAGRKSANKRLTKFADSLMDILEPDGSLDPVKLDHLLRRDVRAKVKDLIGREGGSDYQAALKDVQAFTAEELKGAIDAAGITAPTGRTARVVQMSEARKIASRKRVHGEFTRRIKGTPEEVSVSTRIRTMFEPGNEAKREALEAYDRIHKTNFTERARRLAFKRDWNPDDRVAAHGLDRVLNVIFLGARPVAKAAAVLTRPTQAVVGSQAGRIGGRKREPENLPSP